MNLCRYCFRPDTLPDCFPHAEGCPTVTGLYPSSGKVACYDCACVIMAGEHWVIAGGDDPDTPDLVCVGCGALRAAVAA